MKFVLSLNIFVLICVFSFGQAKPNYTQYVLNNYVLNPALSGIENYVDIKSSFRNQWTGIEGSPVTSYFTIHGPIGKKDDLTTATSFKMQGVNPRGEDYWKNYEAAPAHHGVGLSIVNDKAGYINRWTISGSYAYHIPLTRKTTLAAGISLGVSSINLDRSKVYFGNLDPNDPAIGYANNELQKIKPEIGAGLWLYGSKYYVGASVLNIIPGKNSFVTNLKYGNYFTPNYFLTAGYRFTLDDNFSLLPSFMYQYWQPQLSGLHVNAKLQYQDFVWVGGSYRASNLISGYAAFLGFNISNTINASYSYELATSSRLKNYTGNTHELLIGFVLGNKFGDTCPRNVW